MFLARQFLYLRAQKISRGHFLRLVFKHFENPCRQEFPSSYRRHNDSGVNDMHVARLRFCAVIIVLIELVKITFGRELRRSRQEDRILIYVGDQDELAVLDRHE